MVDRNLVQKLRGSILTTGEGMELHIPPSGFDWRAIHGGGPGVIDPFSENAAQQWPMGTRLVYGERQFRYARANNVAIEVSALVQTRVPLAGHINEVIGTHAIGSVTIDFTPNTVTTDDLDANELQDGHIFIYDDVGEGHMYLILSHPAIVGGASGVLTLVDPVRVAIGASATGTVLINTHQNLIIHPAPMTAKVIGWTQQAIGASAYFWVLTRGPTAALIDSGGAAVVMGEWVVPSLEDDGAVQVFDADIAAEPDVGAVGRVLEIGADAGGNPATYGAVWAELD